MIDGAPGLAAAGMFAFVQSWHEFVLSSVYVVRGLAGGEVKG